MNIFVKLHSLDEVCEVSMPRAYRNCDERGKIHVTNNRLRYIQMQTRQNKTTPHDPVGQNTACYNIKMGFRETRLGGNRGLDSADRIKTSDVLL